VGLIELPGTSRIAVALATQQIADETRGRAEQEIGKGVA